MVKGYLAVDPSTGAKLVTEVLDGMHPKGILFARVQVWLKAALAGLIVAQLCEMWPEKLYAKLRPKAEGSNYYIVANELMNQLVEAGVIKVVE